MFARKKISATVIALVLAVTTLCIGALSAPVKPASLSPAACPCCQANHPDCRSVACCTKRADHPAPVAPAARTTQLNEWQLLVSLHDFTQLPETSQVTPPSRANLFPHPVALPLFQRDCSYLI